METKSCRETEKVAADEAERSDVALALADCWKELPNHLKEEILGRLPMEDVHRYRCVCKKWNVLFSSDMFINLIWPEAPINRQPWLVLCDDTPNTPCLAFCFYRRTWKTCFSLSFLEKPLEHEGIIKVNWRGSAAGVMLVDGVNDARIAAPTRLCNPYTRTFFQLPPMPMITTVVYKCIDNTVLSPSSDTDTVLALGWCWREAAMKLVLEMHDRSQGRWKTLGFLEENSTWNINWCKMVFYNGSFYCVGLHHRELRMGIVGFTIPKRGSDSGAGRLMPIPLLLAPFPEALCKQVYWPHLLTCGSRLLVVADIYVTFQVERAGFEGKSYRRLKEVIVIWEFQNDRLPSNSNSSSWQWKEIARMPPTVFDDFKSISPSSVEWFKCLGIGDQYVCFVPIAICSGQEIKVVVYNLKEGSWIWLPGCYLQNQGHSATVMSMAFQPRPHMKAH